LHNRGSTPDRLVGMTLDVTEARELEKERDPEAVGKATPSWGVGLRSMRERADVLGGSLRVESNRGAGTRVELRVPLDGRR
jgi:signal transduction histidine kinase